MIKTIIALLLLAVAPVAAEEIEPYVVSELAQNLRPTIAFNAQTEQFLIAWIRTGNIVDYEEAIVRARLVTTQPEISIGKEIPISRPSSKKVYAPFVSVRYHPAQSRYVAIWQETLGETRNLMLTTLKDDGSYLRRANRLALKQGILVSPPLIGTVPGTERILVVWNDLLQTGFRSQAFTFDPDKPNSRDNLLFELSGNSNLVQIPLDILSRGDGVFVLYGFMLNTESGVNRYMYRRDVQLDLGPATNDKIVTRRKLRSSMTLDAEGGDESDLILYNLNIPAKDMNALSVFSHAHDAGIARPSADTSPSATAFEGALLAPASVDGMAKLIWVQENEGTNMLLMQHVSTDGEFVGDPIVVRQVSRPISFPTAVWGAEQSEAMVAWCESMDDGTVKLLMTIIDLTEMPQ